MASALEAVLGFFADLIIFTLGLAVLTFWIVILFAVAIEIYDAFTEKPKSDEGDDRS